MAANEVLLRRWPRMLPSHIWKKQDVQRCVFIHVDGTEETSGIDAKGSYEDSKFNKMEADEVVSYYNNSVRLVSFLVIFVDICNQ